MDFEADTNEERRAHIRYCPDPLVPVQFENPPSALQGAGHIRNISEGGVCIVAPPTCETPVRWGNQLRVRFSYSESSRTHGLEGLELDVVVIEVSSGARELLIRGRFKTPELQDHLAAYVSWLQRECSPARGG